MTSDDIFKKLVKDFDETEGERLRKYPIDNVMTMSKVDKIIMDDDLINYLRNEFYGIYMGEPIPKVFSKALIEWRRPGGLVRLYVTFPEDKQIIIQLHEGTEALLECYKHLPNVVGFQDASGGHGIATEEWMLPETTPFGYAGGINPENVIDVVEDLNIICEEDFWIDMETGIRTDDRFDITKCEEICRKLTENGLVG